MRHRGTKAGKRRRVEVTLRGLRVLDHPKNPEEVRGVVVAWERVDFARHRKLFRADGTALDVRGLRLYLGEIDQRVVKRARKRRWDRLIESGELDVTERFDWVRRELVQMVGMLTVCAGLLGVTVWRSTGKWSGIGETLPGFVWIEWVVVALIVAMPICIFGFILKQAVNLGRVDAFSIRACGDRIEVTDRRGTTSTHFWSDLRSVKRDLGVDVLEFAEGRRVRVPYGRLHPVIRWHRERLAPVTMERVRREAWRRAAVCLGISIVCGLFAAVVIARTPDMEIEQTPLAIFGTMTGMGLVMSAMLWWSAIQEARGPRRARSRAAARR